MTGTSAVIGKATDKARDNTRTSDNENLRLNKLVFHTPGQARRDKEFRIRFAKRIKLWISKHAQRHRTTFLKHQNWSAENGQVQKILTLSKSTGSNCQGI